MKIIVMLLLVVSLGGCSVVRERLDTSPGPASEITEAPAANSRTSNVSPPMSLGELLKHRARLCQQDKVIRNDQLKQIRAKSFKTRRSPNNAPSVNEKLDGLLITTCEFASTPTVFNEMMTNISNEGKWPADYEAFFDLLRAPQRSLTLLQNHALEMNRELEVTKAKLDTLQGDYKKTIKGVGEIEENIDSRTQKSPEVQNVASNYIIGR